MMIQLNKETARILAPIVHNIEVREALVDYARYKIEEIQKRLCSGIDPNNSTAIAHMQGQFTELNILLTLKEDAQEAMKGSI